MRKLRKFRLYKSAIYVISSNLDQDLILKKRTICSYWPEIKARYGIIMHGKIDKKLCVIWDLGYIHKLKKLVRLLGQCLQYTINKGDED